MPTIKNAYRVVRSVLFAAVVTVVTLFVLLYVALSTPWIIDKIRHRSEIELSQYFKAPVRIGDASVMPFNEVQISDVEFLTPNGEHCINVERIGAGISLWNLLFKGEIQVTYAELIGLKAHVVQFREDGPLNIQFIIDAFKPKNPNNPPTHFDLKLRNVVIRKSSLTFDRVWKPASEGKLNLNHISLDNIRADVAIPRLSNEEYKVKLRRLSFREKSGLYVDALSFDADITPELISLKDFNLKLDRTEVLLNNLEYKLEGFASIPRILKESVHDIRLSVRNFKPSELAFLDRRLNKVEGIYNLSLNAGGTLSDFVIRGLDLSSPDNRLSMALEGKVAGLPDVKKLTADIVDLELKADADRINELLSFVPSISDEVQETISKARTLGISGNGSVSLAERAGYFSGDIDCAQGLLSLDGKASWKQGLRTEFTLASDGLQLDELLDKQPVNRIALNLEASASIIGKDIEGSFHLQVPSVFVNGHELANIEAKGNKNGNRIGGFVEVDCPLASGNVNLECVLAGPESGWDVDGKVGHLNAAAMGLKGKYAGIISAGSIIASITGNNPDNLQGDIHLSDLRCAPFTGSDIAVKNLWVSAQGDNEYRHVNIISDMLSGDVEGSFKYSDLAKCATSTLAYALPSYIKHPSQSASGSTDMKVNLVLHPDDELYSALNLNVRPEEDVKLSGFIKDDNIELNVIAPYLLKGSDKLIKGTELTVKATPYDGLAVEGVSNLPNKYGYMGLQVSANALEDKMGSAVSWKFDHNRDKGAVNVAVQLKRDNGRATSVLFDILESDLVMNGAKWEMTPAHGEFSDKVLSVDNLTLKHGDQFLTVNGRASSSPADTLHATLRDIDLGYIFNTLNINYVTFGGMATGEAYGTSLFSKQPVARANGLKIRNFSYNSSVLGDAVVSGGWDNSTKSISIDADIMNSEGLPTFANGRVYIGGDSLHFNFDANKINIAFIEPFVSGFMEDVRGQATGNVQLFGTFKNIALVGAAKVDTASVKIGYTNVTYHGSDSLIFYLDRINIPGFRIHDKYGNSALVAGDVHHDYFHRARVNIGFDEVKNLLCYDTDSRSNPVWWGRIFASGSGRVTGRPGYTLLSFNAASAPNSSFTFSLDETQTASEYTFLTFTDKRKEEAIIVGEETLEDKYRKKKKEEQEDKSVFEIDMSVALTPGIKMNVIMDPSAGDKISATGNGALRLNYNSFADNLNVFGRYVINDGGYRFSFQDIILRDFKIKSGSSISFNGDPMQGILDLTAGYRVNTNLTDLDKSFATDRELNRSSIPVEALLKVTGNLTQPDIAFDIALPTMTSDVERKVRSIVSSEEMLNQQVLYLLALNRFYTPQFSGGSDGELISVASSTLSSQVANVLSQITDKVTLNPSFKSDRNDFSDMEVDLALSSQLFDNRLTINGNLGYRDRSISQSTFIGDFDIEYMLSRNGALSLKAYNHFNDAYYYLKSALTTQGIGLVYRKEFDDPFAFLKHRKKKKKK